MILALAGGVGGAKLARGLANVLAPDELMVVVNTGDDFEHLGMHISPDVDTVVYTVAGINDPIQGWGIAGETWGFMRALETLGGETWFRLGDRDLAVHVERTRRLRKGETLSSITSDFCERLGIRHRIVPMSDDPVPTIVHTNEGPLSFQDYFVRRRSEPVVTGLEFSGVEQARMAEAISSAASSESLAAVVICPSNPYLSISPILAVPGVRSILEHRRVPAIAVSPLVGGRALKGPAAKIMQELGKEPSSLEIARFYRGLIDVLVLDHTDVVLAESIRSLGITPVITNTIMREDEDRSDLASRVIGLARSTAITATQ
jgi:LPPG:FO 2-phospho-L-lactate transferase